MSPCLMFHHWYEDWDPWMKGVAWPLRDMQIPLERGRDG